VEALKLFDKCRSLIDATTKPETAYEIYVNLGLLLSGLDSPIEVAEHHYINASKYCPERAEPYFYLSIYCQRKLNYEKVYELLNKARLLSYDVANHKYPNVQRNAYGKYVNDNLADACYRLKKYDEAIELIECILDDPDFSEQRDRLNKNLALNRDELTKDLLIN
jgi:tetratricopeptide (TPR) repeat protein